MKYLFIFIIFCFLLTATYPYLFSVQATSDLPEKSINIKKQDAQNLPGVPGTIEEAERMGKEFLARFPEALKKSWQEGLVIWEDRKSTRLNSSHTDISRMPSSA